MRALSLGTGSRKAAMFIVAMGISTAMLWFGKITGQDWIGLVQWLFAFLAAGLSAEHFATRGEGGSK